MVRTVSSHALQPGAYERPTHRHEPVDRVTLGESRPVTVRRHLRAVPGPVVAPGPGVHDVKVVHRVSSSDGGWIELLRDPDPHFVQRHFAPCQVQKNPDVVRAFGTDTPPSGDVLLHYAGDPPAGVPVQPTPVILVHGATKDGHFWWDPKENGTLDGPAVSLRKQGYRVFAVTFAHNQDDNYFQAQQLENAMGRVRALTGAPQVDVVGHSKGGVPARMVPSNFRQDWMTPYQGDVRRLALVASPNGGLDYSFRHSAANPVLSTGMFNAPMSWDRAGIGFFSVSTKDQGFSHEGSDLFPGQDQLLDTWDKTYPLPAWEQDWWTTYYGGQGFVSHSQGIEKTMAQSGNFMRRLEETPVDPHVEIGLLAGNRANIPGIMNEFTGPSDGLLFVKSALQAPPDSCVVRATVLPLHHKAVVSDPAGQKWLSDFLSATSLKPMTSAQIAAVEQRGESTAS